MHYGIAFSLKGTCDAFLEFVQKQGILEQQHHVAYILKHSYDALK